MKSRGHSMCVFRSLLLFSLYLSKPASLSLSLLSPLASLLRAFNAKSGGEVIDEDEDEDEDEQVAVISPSSSLVPFL